MNRRRQHRDPQLASTTLPQSDIGRMDPPRVTAHRPVKRWEERQGEAIANQTAALNMWQQMAESIGGLLILTRANAPGDAIGTGTELITSGGANQRGFPATFQSVAITNFSSSQMVAAAAPAQSQAPSVGPGVYLIPAGAYRVIPLRGTVVTVYGVAGSAYDLTVYSKPRPMDFAAIPPGSAVGTSQSATIGNPAAGANFNIVPSATQPVLIQAVQFILSTSATVANRQGAIVLAGSTFTSPAPQAASTASVTDLFTPSAPTTTAAPGAGSTVTFPLPPGIILPAGGAIASAVVNLQAADQISGVSVLYQPQPAV